MVLRLEIRKKFGSGDAGGFMFFNGDFCLYYHTWGTYYQVCTYNVANQYIWWKTNGGWK